MSDISNRIKAVRKALGFTQAQLAERWGANRISIANWENGHKKPGPMVIAHLRRDEELSGLPSDS